MSAKTSKRSLGRSFALQNAVSLPSKGMNKTKKQENAADKYWVNDDPVLTSFFSALALSLPMEKQFSITALSALECAFPAELSRKLKSFVGAESLRGRGYSLFNRTNVYPRYDVAPVEAIIKATIENETRKSPATRLLHTICMKHILVNIAQELLENDAHFSGVETDIREIWQCHSASEVEQKNVCFEAWLEMTRDWDGVRRWLTQTLAMIVVSFVFSRNSLRAMRLFLAQDGVVGMRATIAIVWSQLKKGSFFRGVLRRWFRFFLPGLRPA